VVENFYTSTSTSTASTTWQYWTGSTSTSVSNVTTTGDIVWNGWANSTTSASTSTWDAWTSSTATVTSAGLTPTMWNAWVADDLQPLSRPRHSDAVKRADKLLVEHLTEEQEQSLAAQGYFDVDTIVKGEKKRFRIHNNKYQHNVFEIDQDGRKLRELCAHTSHACPQSDHALAQKLMLEHNPAEFLRVANIWDLRNDRRDLRVD
jgi:hypothetical protein